MQENNIHASYPYSIIVHHGKQIVFLALPPKATWVEARRSYAALMNLDPSQTVLAPWFATATRESPRLPKDDAVIEWPKNEYVHVTAITGTPGGVWTSVPSQYRPIEARRRGIETIPSAVCEYLNAKQAVSPSR
ncbi:uncharacterized protein TM35_000071820 [Trypanosoma theileri]|uniref:Uncharacterized protein n=1 Tax=Trypanosoma theileri TaxID=67003 RepID=A0A1X0P1P9_9TRYP|nr:uncharacterized protein TM35_000071820 [Trypanosoma theileri]ORC90758.1 hypothetical protein TM35_000071820 [Trypanosoma theileri]